MDYESAETLLSIKNGGYPSVDQIKTEIEDEMMDIDEHQISANSLDSSMEAEPVDGDGDEDKTDEEDEENNDDGDEEEEAMPELGPAALGLQRVGTQPPRKSKPPTQPIQVLNRRGMPARIRKKNKLFYDDIMVNHPHHRIKKEPGSLDVKPSPKKMPRPSPAKKMLRMSGGDSMKKGSGGGGGGGGNSIRETSYLQSPMKEEREQTSKPPMMKMQHQHHHHHHQQQQQQHQQQPQQQQQQQQPSSPDRRIGQKIGMRLRNLLKLPKAHKWVCYEWFYSNIDKTLFEGDNDFMICLKESFPQLKTRKLTRVEWCKIRRMMGKPRRCSQSFFEEERRELERKRQKIRMLQQRKCSDVQMFKDLPSEIPLQLVIGTKVTARLRKPQDGLFTGSIDAVDTSNNTYRITFERAGLGTHSVPDYEVLGNEPPETITVASFARKFRPSHVQYVPSPPYMSKLNSSSSSGINSPRLSGSDPLISSSNASIPKKSHMGGTMNGYPVKLLESMVRLRKILSEKKVKVDKLKEMNTDCEMRRSLGEPLPPEFERKYAGIVVELERMNLALQDFLNEVQDMCLDMAPEPSVAAMLAPSHLREKCRQEASDMVAKNNMINDKEPNKMTQLVTDLTALILQVKCLSDSDKNAYELQVLQGTMEQIKSKLAPQNLQVFQNCVEVHMQHIQLGLGQLGALTPFMTQKT